MLIDNERHRKHHSVGPKDCHWGKPKMAVTTIRVTRSTISDEQMEVLIPVFSDDTRESLDLRLGMMMSLAQDRRDDVNLAYAEAEENQAKLIEQTKVKAGLLTHEEKQKLVDEKKK
jgi:hypothetical protein